MPVAALAQPRSEPTRTEAPQRFPFVVNTQPLVRGTVGALVIIGLLFTWGWFTGRVDRTDAAALVGIVLASVCIAIGMLWRQARKAASSLGGIELDDEGVRWRRPDGTLGFETPWMEVKLATVDSREFCIHLTCKTGAPVLLGVMSNNGAPSGFVIPGRFSELVDQLKARVPTNVHGGVQDVATATRTIVLGALCCAVAGVLYGVNLSIASAAVSAPRISNPVPIVLAIFGLILVGAGLRIGLGKGPMVSMLYSPSYRNGVIRVLVLAIIANFVLVALR